MTDNDLTSPQTLEVPLRTDIAMDIISPSLPSEEANMVPAESISAETRVLAGSLGAPPDTAAPCSANNGSAKAVKKTISLENQHLSVGTEAATFMASYFMYSDESIMAASETSSETQELLNPVNSTFSNALRSLETDESVPSENLLPPSPELMPSTEGIAALKPQLSMDDVPTSAFDLIMTSSREDQEESDLAAPPPDIVPSHATIDGSNEKSRPIEVNLAETSELPFGPFLVEGSSNRNLAAGPVDASDLLSEAVELMSSHGHGLSDFVKDPPSINSHFLDGGHTNMTSEVNEHSWYEPTKLEVSTHSDATEASQGTHLSPLPPINSNAGCDTIQSAFTELLKLNRSIQAAPEIPAPPCGADTRPEQDASTVELILQETQKTYLSEDFSAMDTALIFSANPLNTVSESADTGSIDATDFFFSTGSNLDTGSPSVAVDNFPMATENFGMSKADVEDKTVSSILPILSSPTFSIGCMDLCLQLDEANTGHMQELDLPAPALADLESITADDTTMADLSKLIAPETKHRTILDATPNSPGFSIDEHAPPRRKFLPSWEIQRYDIDNSHTRVMDRSQVFDAADDFDDTKMAEISELISLADAGLDVPEPLVYEMLTISSKPFQRSSPEIKMEPVSADAITYMDALPSAINNSGIKSEPREKSPPVSPWSEVALDRATPVDTDASNMIRELIVLNSSEPQVILDSITQGPASRYMIPADTFQSPRKRVRFDIEEVGEDQQPPAKKLHQDFTAVVEKTKTEESEVKLEKLEMNLLDIQQLPNSTKVERNMISPLSTPTDTNINRSKTGTGQHDTRDISLLADLPPVLSREIKEDGQEISVVKTKKKVANDTIELHVGPKNKCVLAHKHILAKSPFFASLIGQYPNHNSSSQAYHFPQFDTYALATIIHWLYHGNIRSIAEDYKADGIFNTTHMIKVSYLCFKLQLRSLQNLTIELLGHGYLKNNSAPTIEEIDIAYSESEQWSVLRIYMATWAQCREHAPLQKYMMAGPWDQERFKALCKKHPSLAKDIENVSDSLGLGSSISLNPRFHAICSYHDHPPGERCGVANRTFDSASNGMQSRISEPF